MEVRCPRCSSPIPEEDATKEPNAYISAFLPDGRVEIEMFCPACNETTAYVRIRREDWIRTP